MNNTDEANKHLATIAKALAFLCASTGDMKGKSLGEKAKFLRRLGFADKDVAGLLNTSENSVRVQISLSKKSTSKKSKPKIQQEDKG
jgi:hypothetical protein